MQDNDTISSNITDYYIHNLSGSDVCSLWSYFSINNTLRQEQINILNGESEILKNFTTKISAINIDKIARSIYSFQYIDAINPIVSKTTLSSYKFFETTTDYLNVNLFDNIFFTEDYYTSKSQFKSLKDYTVLKNNLSAIKTAEDILKLKTEERTLLDHTDLPCSVWMYKKLNQISFNIIEDIKNIKHKISHKQFKNADSISFISPHLLNNNPYTVYSFTPYASSVDIILDNKRLLRRVQDTSDKQMLMLSAATVSASHIEDINNSISSYNLQISSNLNSFINLSGIEEINLIYTKDFNGHNIIVNNALNQPFVGNNIQDFKYKSELQKIKQEIIDKNNENTKFLLSISCYYSAPFPHLPIFFVPKTRDLKSEYYDVTFPTIQIDYSNNKLNYIQEYIKYRLI